MNLRTSCVLLAGIGQIALTASALGQSPQSTADSSGQEAQKQEAGGIADIVVTAQRREESLQRAGVAVSAVSGEDLTSAGITDSVNIGKLVPALIAQPSAGSTSFYLRGVGTNVGNSFRDNAVAFNFAGVFVSRPSAPVGAFYDLQRIEVVKGP